MATSALLRRNDEDLLNRSLLDSIEAAESHAERVDTTRDVSSPPSFAYPLSPQSPVSTNPLQYTDAYLTDDYPHRPSLVTRLPPQYPSYQLDHHHSRSATLPLSHPSREQRFQSPIDGYGFPRQYDQRVENRDFLKSSQYAAPLYQPGLTTQTPTIVHHHNHRDEEISTIFVVGFPDDMQVSAIGHRLRLW